jgi:hypothetical protein
MNTKLYYNAITASHFSHMCVLCHWIACHTRPAGSQTESHFFKGQISQYLISHINFFKALQQRKQTLRGLFCELRAVISRTRSRLESKLGSIERKSRDASIELHVGCGLYGFGVHLLSTQSILFFFS